MLRNYADNDLSASDFLYGIETGPSVRRRRIYFKGDRNHVQSD